MEEKKRSFAKAITWRIIAILITLIFAVLFMDVERALLLTLLIHTVKTIAYYLLERAWDRIEWGRKCRNQS